jgi:hypothetical protein
MAERRAKEPEDPAALERIEERRTPDGAVAPRNGSRPVGSVVGAKDDLPLLTGVAVPGPPSTVGPWRSHKEIIARLADRIVDAQKPIRVLQALRWDDSIEDQFFKSRPRVLPKVDVAYYENVDLGFEPRAKIEEFDAIASDIDKELGDSDAVGAIMLTTALEYRDVVRMLTARGTPAFYAASRKLYGSPKDTFPDGRSTVRDLGRLLYGILTSVDEREGAGRLAYSRTIDAPEAARQLGERLATFFGHAHVRVEADNGILADATM